MSDVFISYSQNDLAIAHAVCKSLESDGLKCWIAPRDIPGGIWAGQIIDAIAASSVLVLILSSSSNESPHVEREVNCASDKRVPIVPLKVNALQLSKSMDFYISTSQFVDATTDPPELYMARLRKAVEHVMRTKRELPEPPIRRTFGKKKILLLGAFGVGKTSLVSRFVLSVVTDKYHSSVGMKIDKKLLSIDGNNVELMLWDLAGEDELNKVNTIYLRGADGYLLVIDGTRGGTFDTAFTLRDRVEREVGTIPYVVIINKTDLAGTDKWQLTQEHDALLAAQNLTVIKTSAKTGAGVEEAFLAIATHATRGR